METDLGEPHRVPSHISKTVLSIVKIGPPEPIMRVLRLHRLLPGGSSPRYPSPQWESFYEKFPSPQSCSSSQPALLEVSIHIQSHDKA